MKILDEREKAKLEKIEEWKLSLPRYDKELLEITKNYAKRHEQPRSKITRLKEKITNLCQKVIPDKFKYYCAAKDSRTMCLIMIAGISPISLIIAKLN